MSPEYSEVEFYAKGTECSVNYKLSPQVFMGDLQETADTGAKDCGFDRFVLDKYNICWILLRMKVHIDDMPRWRDSFKIRTWSCGLEKLFFDREYEAYNTNGDVIAYGSSLWIMADMNSHKPVIPSKVEGLTDFPVQNSKLVFGSRCGKLKTTSLEELGHPVLSKYGDYSELDWNNHVNNTRYIAWVCDAVNKAGYDPSTITDFEINYISEVKLGEKVDLYVKKNDNIINVYGFRDDGSGVFVTELALCN